MFGGDSIPKYQTVAPEPNVRCMSKKVLDREVLGLSIASVSIHPADDKGALSFTEKFP